MKRLAILLLLTVTAFSFSSTSIAEEDGKLRIIAFGAHPDDCEFQMAGTAVKWAQLGHHVKRGRVPGRGAQVFSVAIDSARGVSSAKPRAWFSGQYVFGSEHNYDVAPDGRLLMIKRDPEEMASRGLRVVLNWVDELARRVPNSQ